MRHVLENNVFEYDEKLYLQLIGTAMGTESAVNYANLFMKTIDILIKDSAIKHKRLQLNHNPNTDSDQDNSNTDSNSDIHTMWRFIDDGFLLWLGTEQNLIKFIALLNTLHPTIKFTASFNFQTKSVIFLDTTVTIKNGIITTDLYRKLIKPCDKGAGTIIFQWLFLGH